MAAVISADNTQLVMKSCDAGSGRLSFWLLPLRRTTDVAGGLATNPETGGFRPPSFWLDPLPAARPALLFSAAPVPRPRTIVTLTGGVLDFAIGAGHLYFTRQEPQTAIWIGDLVTDMVQVL